MIKKIHIVKYRKLQDMDFDLSKGINVISGTNGTCKTSLLHIVSNAYQAVTKNCDWLQDASCLDVIKQINSMTNPKIESLTKGDKVYNDPANGTKGTLFTVDYYGHAPLEFRKHNSKLSSRYAVKPWYRPGTTEKLPFCPVIYLGLTRLYPFGEYLNEAAVEKLKKNLPVEYQNEIADIYKRLTGISISAVSPQKMGDIKTRADFESDKAGIDSNTISAGEDNLFIIISALVSLKYYFENITSTNEIESVLLIDEFDATLHPSLQFKLLDIFRTYSSDYKIQIAFTTHSCMIMIRHFGRLLPFWISITGIYLLQDTTRPLELGFATFFLNRTNVSGVVNGGIIGGQEQTGKYKLDARFNRDTLSEKILKISEQRSRIVLFNQDAKELLSPQQLRKF